MSIGETTMKRSLFLAFIPLIAALCFVRAAYCADIHDSVKDGNLDKIKEQLDQSPDFAILRDSSDRTPFHYAVERGDEKILQLLLDTKPEPRGLNALDNKNLSALDIAAAKGNI